MRVRFRGRLRLRSVVLGFSIPLVIAASQRPTSSLSGSWWESGWKLCTPAAQLTAADVDPPIEDLTFREDGTFSVTWRGGGAHTGDIPHVFIPDYSGHYTTDADAHRIAMRIDNGLFVPRDFRGDGTYAIEGNALTLVHVWFGTKQARHPPDICELTFTRR